MKSANEICDLRVTGEVLEKVRVIELAWGSVRFNIGDNDMGVKAPINHTSKKRVGCCFRDCFESGPSGRIDVEKAKDEVENFKWKYSLQNSERTN